MHTHRTSKFLFYHNLVRDLNYDIFSSQMIYALFSQFQEFDLSK